MVHNLRPAATVIGLGLLGAALVSLLAGERNAAGSLLPHGYCFTWNPTLLWTHVVSDGLIGAAYVSIPFTLLHLVRQRKDLPFDWIVLLFAVFIVSCGATHMIEVWTVWQPDYWLSATVKVITATASVLTAIALIRLVPRILAIPTVAELRAARDSLQAEVARRAAVEATLMRERAELEQRVQERTEALQRASAEARAAHEQAEQANRMKDIFLAKISHELRTPLQASLSWAQILQRGAQDPARAAAAAERVVVNVKAQARMIDDLLDLSRVLSGKLSLSPEPVSAAGLLRGAVEVVRSANPGRPLELDIGCDDSTVFVDPLRLEQVFWNLINNAFQATASGGQVRVTCRATAEAVIVEVQDDGRGIDAAELPHLFEPFRQAQPGGGAHRGLGLGLAIARNIVDLSGGTLQARSAGLGSGATFSVCLPRSRTPATASEGAAAAAGLGDLSALRGLRVLYVENEPDIAESVRQMLQALGAAVELCLGHDEALACLAGRDFDLMLCDLNLGAGHSAIGLMQRLRADPRHRRMIGVLLSAHGTAQDRQASAQAGFVRHLVKPVDIDTLARTLLEVWDPRAAP